MTATVLPIELIAAARAWRRDTHLAPLPFLPLPFPQHRCRPPGVRALLGAAAQWELGERVMKQLYLFGHQPVTKPKGDAAIVFEALQKSLPKGWPVNVSDNVATRRAIFNDKGAIFNAF